MRMRMGRGMRTQRVRIRNMRTSREQECSAVGATRGSEIDGLR